MKHLLLFASICLFAIHLDGQTTIKGLVKDQVTRQGVEIATVYINGTTIGTNTDMAGFFELKVPNFPVQIVVSHVSYKNVTFVLEAPKSDTLLIYTEEENVDLTTIKVTDTDNREKNLKEFKESFLGIDEFGTRAKILNDDVLFFERIYSPGGRQTGRGLQLLANTKRSLILDLPDLGYKVTIELPQFELTYGQKLNESTTANWLVYTYFQPYVPKNKAKKRFIEKNRKRAYYHSQLHFFRSLYHNTLEENGYQTFVLAVDSVTQTEKYIPYSMYDHATYGEDELMELIGLKDKKIIIFYYDKGNGTPFDIKKFRDKEAKKAKKANKIYEKKPIPVKPVNSFLLFAKNNCKIRPDGTSPEYSIIAGGPLSAKKMGAALPEDYEIVKEDTDGIN